jgi:hypothetical protein
MSSGDTAGLIMSEGISASWEPTIESLKELLTKRHWYEECLLLERYHFLMQAQKGYPVGGRSKSGWSMKDTADSLNRSLHSVMMDLRLAKRGKINSTIALAPTKQKGQLVMEKSDGQESRISS